MHNHGGHHHGGNGNNRPNHGNFKTDNGNGNNNQHRQVPAQKDLSHITCFKCQKTGHYATECPQSKQRNGNGNSAAKKPNPFPRAQVNHLDVEEVYDQPETVVGKFLLHSRPVTVLFDSGATHSFISRVVVEKYGLPTKTLSQPIKVSSPGGMTMAGIGCHALKLNIGNHVFPTDLIILESQGLDVILGMDWMTKYEGNLDCPSKSVSLTTPENKRIKYVSRRTRMSARLNSLT